MEEKVRWVLGWEKRVGLEERLEESRSGSHGVLE